MPELPEVETVMRGIAPALEGRRLRRVLARRPDLRWPLPPRFAERLQGRRVERLWRRSKYIVAELDDAAAWILHLGMSGRISVAARTGSGAQQVGVFHHEVGVPPGPGDDPDALGPHDHIVVDTDAARLIYTDARRFGAMDLADRDDVLAHKWLAGLGPEPLGAGFDAAYLERRLSGRVAAIKSLLLDQRMVAGLGNIYVCEALWRAMIDPRRAAGDIPRATLAKLVKAVKRVLAEAIEAGGSSLRDHRQVDGELGYFQHAFAVYGRAGEPCARRGCAGRIDRVVQGGRSSFYCPTCQK